MLGPGVYRTPAGSRATREAVKFALKVGYRHKMKRPAKRGA
jgi:hypothetical protein